MSRLTDQFKSTIESTASHLDSVNWVDIKQQFHQMSSKACFKCKGYTECYNKNNCSYGTETHIYKRLDIGAINEKIVSQK